MRDGADKAVQQLRAEADVWRAKLRWSLVSANEAVLGVGQLMANERLPATRALKWSLSTMIIQKPK